ncbi:MAG: glycoside hydrolase family 5 protein [Limisphaerales bacterium]
MPTCLWTAFVTMALIAVMIAQGAETNAPSLLPAGFLSVRGSQFVGPNGGPVRIASVGMSGLNIVGGRLNLERRFHGYEENAAVMKDMGFNCARVDWIDKTLEDDAAMSELDRFVAACAKTGLKVIFDNHNNEATRSNWDNAAQQKNGLWFDTGPGTDGTDGTSRKGTISAARFQDDWVKFARHWAGNPAVIGFDLRNEPCAHTSTPALWGGGGPTDIRAMCERVGNAILAVNPDALIICEAVIDYRHGAYEGDLSVARDLPVKLSNPAKLVYSVHEYPKEIGDYRGPEEGPGYIARMNKMWGWLIGENIAPVWIGEMGASMSSEASRKWGATLLAYMNGNAPGGLTLPADAPGVSGDWWEWGCATGQNPDGCVREDGKMRPEQQVFIEQMQFRPQAHLPKP